MAQHDFNIDNQSAPAFRGDLNNALEALGTLSSGATAPATTYANMLWYDTANNILKMRSEADDAWIDLGTLDQSANTFVPAGLINLSQAQAEDDTSTVFGQVSGQRLAQAGVVSFTDQEQQIGVGQTWQAVSRTSGTVYQNTTGRPIACTCILNTTGDTAFYVSPDNITFTKLDFGNGSSGTRSHAFAIVPNGQYYYYGSIAFDSAVELR